MTHRNWLRCDDPACSKPIAEIRDGKLLILQRHDRSWHMTAFTIRQVEQILERMRQSEEVASLTS